MSATTKAELKRPDAPNSASDQPAKPRRKRAAGSPDDVSRALRSAYDDALNEQVPDDFLNLLGKLS